MKSRAIVHLLQAVLAIVVALSSIHQARAAAASHSGQPLAIPTSPAQNPLEGMGLIFEGQSLVTRQTKQAITEGIAKFKEAFALCQKNDNKGGMGSARLWEGIAYDSLGKQREALSAFLDASRYLEEGGFGFMNPMVFAATGAAYASLGETDNALDLLNRALPSLRRANIPQFTAYALKGLGEVNVRIGQKHKALEYLNEALGLYRQTGDWRHEVHVLVLISTVRSTLGQSTEAMQSAREAVDRSKEKSAADWEPYGHLAVGSAYASVGNLTQAATEYNHALQLFRAQKDDSGEATTLNQLGLIYVTRGDLHLALDCFNRSLKLYEANGEPEFAAYALTNIGTIYSRRGDPLMAFRYFEKALAFAGAHKDSRLEAGVLSSMADSYFSVESPNHALRLLKAAAAAFAAVEEPGHESEAMISLADGYASVGRYQEALDALRPVLASRRVAEDPGRQGYALREMGHVYTLMGERGKALTHYTEALSRLEAAGDAIGQLDLYEALGSIYLSDGDYQKSEELYSKGLLLARAGGLRQNQLLILAGLGHLHEKQGNLTQAESFYDQEVAVSESLRSSARIEELKTELGSISARLLPSAILLKFKLGKLSEAFDLTEKARARTFLDQMNSGHIDIRKGVDSELAGQEQSLRFDMRALEEKLRLEYRTNPRSEAVRVMAASLKEKEETYAALLIRLKASNPGYAQLQSASPIPLGQVQRLLGPQTTMVSYFVTPDKTLAFVVGRDSLQAVEIPVKEAELQAEIDWFRGFSSLRDAEHENLKRLEAWLIAPIRQYIKTSEVVIVSHGVLNYLPFAALTDGNRYFGEGHSIHHLPSASTLAALRHRVRRGGEHVLVLAQSQSPGLPSLRYADEEARIVARLYRTRPLSMGRATRAEFLKRASAYNVLHIAAHAELKPTSPLFSRILLSSDRGDSGALEVREIYGMDLAKADLVTLSACETQLGAQSKGDDIVGLNRAFIYAGASSVIASLWTVDDQATSLLMKVFYDHLRRGMDKASALQVAQAATRKKYPHPYYWAGFILTGDPGGNGTR